MLNDVVKNLRTQTDFVLAFSLCVQSLPKVIGTPNNLRCVLYFLILCPDTSISAPPSLRNNIDNLEKYHKKSAKENAS